ncbi:hypothetical protein PPACK8108_LOCUS8380 [Phakopsora pachyrhizi]|uniref:Uncharacterized protein n=1 Tax=Phakopsora pachyrhizi TaxID=170000 RepID=A0AAV0AUK0_PHAPC|nr:hypothetical protein PPACK8108_LOCUS8380 [Phakopsora pachyrhizi]
MILEKALDKTEFLSIYGICSLSLYHTDNSYKMEVNGQTFSVDYWPGNSKSGMFGIHKTDKKDSHSDICISNNTNK